MPPHPPLAWPHRKSPAPSVRARRITACDSRESSKSNLQGNRPPKVKNQQIRLLQHTQSASPPKGFRILHGRLLSVSSTLLDLRFSVTRKSRSRYALQEDLALVVRHCWR